MKTISHSNESMAIRRRKNHINFLFFVILILNFSKCLLSQDVGISTDSPVIADEGITTEKNFPDKIDETGEAGISENPAILVEDATNLTDLPGTEKSSATDESASVTEVRTEVPENSGTTERINAETESQTLGEEESSTQNSEVINESTLSNLNPELTTLELQISVSDGQCVCGCNSGDNPKVECSTNSAIETTVSELENDPNPTTQSPTQETNPCTEIGDFPNPNDCNAYYSCTQGATPNDPLQRVERTCPPKSAFSSKLKRCSRDISTCSQHAAISCSVAGNLPDPLSNSSYYWCAEDFNGGFYKYHIECDISEIFIPEIAKCFIDFQNIGSSAWSFGNGPFGMKLPSDRDVVKAEWKLLKAQEKARLKQLKKQLKYEKKLQEEIEKKAMKDKKAKAAEEAKQFVCVEEGNFPSTFGADRYIACINKKGKLKATGMFCGIGYSFDSNSQICVLPTGAPQPIKNDDDNSNESDDDD